MFNITQLFLTAWILNALFCIELICCAPTSNILMETKLYKRGGGQIAVQNQIHQSGSQGIKRKAIEALGHHESKLHVRTGVNLNHVSMMDIHSSSQHSTSPIHPTSPSQRERLERLKQTVEPYNVVSNYYFD